MTGSPADLRVAVVGAGLAGLACGRRLSEAGAAVRVFERDERPGGRLRGHRGGGLGFDLGAQYFTVRDARFAERVERWRGAGVAREWDGRFAILRDGEVRDEADAPSRHVGVPSMETVAREMARSTEVATGRGVDLVEPAGPGQGRWRLWAGAEDLGAYDALAVAVPPPAAATLLREPAPRVAARCARLELRPCWAVAAGFPAELGFRFDGAFVEDSPLAWVARDTSKPGRDAPVDGWVLHATPRWSERTRDEAPARVRERLLEAFFRATGTRSVAAFYAHPHFWPDARVTEPLEEGSLYEPEAGAGACGDWAAGNRVEGAFLSGLDLAERILSRPGG